MTFDAERSLIQCLSLSSLLLLVMNARLLRRFVGLVKFHQRWLRYLLIAGLVALLSVAPTMLKAQVSVGSTPVPTAIAAPELLQQGQDLYETGQFQAAIAVLRLAIRAYEEQGDRLRQAIAFSNLSLAYQQLGAWTEATEAMTASLTLLQDTAVSAAVSAQVLNVQGRLQFSQGQSELALTTWEQATAAYEQAGDAAGAIEARLNQAQALQALGLYRRAIALLTDLSQTLQAQPVSLMQAVALRSLGEALQAGGDLGQAHRVLQQSLSVAEQLQLPEAIAAANLSLGNLTRAEATAALGANNLTVAEAIDRLHRPAEARQQTEVVQAFDQQTETALNFYQQAVQQATLDRTRLQAQLNQFSLLVATQRWPLAEALSPDLQTQLAQQPVTRTSIYNQIDFAQSLIQLQGHETASAAIAQTGVELLTRASEQAAALGDDRAQSYALGSLGKLYEQTQQWQEAQALTQRALLLAQTLSAADVAYRWQWQLGRLLQAQGDRSGATAAYSEAVAALQQLRNDLVAVNRDVQFSFRESVEPVYRQLVELLLPLEAEPSAPNLIKAREVIEGLQIAELDNFFREACLDTAFQLDRVVDQANLPAAIFYTIVLPDRLEVILKLPQQALRHYTATVSQSEVQQTVDELLSQLRRPYAARSLQTLAQQMYGWLIRPAEQDLINSQVDTLVFVLDGALRNIPMAVLHDGQQYLVEKYNLALAPGLQLPDPQPFDPSQLRVLVAGLSEARSNFPPLNFVQTEVAEIRADVPSEVLFNQSFTRENFQNLLNAAPFSIVHIATHGQFSSNAAETFILAWDNPINVNELSSLLQTRDLMNTEPIELLVLSACQTAVGDRRATLGLAGVAVRAGARSTIASLWSLDDNSGAALMKAFYQELIKAPVSKSQALRQAQLSLLANPQYAAPRFWAPYVLLGNWL